MRTEFQVFTQYFQLLLVIVIATLDEERAESAECRIWIRSIIPKRSHHSLLTIYSNPGDGVVVGVAGSGWWGILHTGRERKCIRHIFYGCRSVIKGVTRQTILHMKHAYGSNIKSANPDRLINIFRRQEWPPAPLLNGRCDLQLNHFHCSYANNFSQILVYALVEYRTCILINRDAFLQFEMFNRWRHQIWFHETFETARKGVREELITFVNLVLLSFHCLPRKWNKERGKINYTRNLQHTYNSISKSEMSSSTICSKGFQPLGQRFNPLQTWSSMDSLKRRICFPRTATWILSPWSLTNWLQ